jgi:hypothetical protein
MVRVAKPGGVVALQEPDCGCWVGVEAALRRAWMGPVLELVSQVTVVRVCAPAVTNLTGVS